MHHAHFRAVVSVLISTLCLIAAQPAAAQADLNGRWISDGTVFEITQTGSSVSLTFLDVPFSGTVTPDGHLFAFATQPVCVPPGLAGIDARLKADAYLDGVVGCDFFVSRFLARRCQCFDGNASDGDGCDSECQVEPCFACTGDPSVCTPLGDGAPCDDGDCTTGETCTGGVCGGGTTDTVFCTDLTGRWLIEGRSSLIGFVEFTQDIVQRNHALEFRSVQTGTLQSVGSIDSFTGVFAVSAPVTDPICVALEGTGLAGSLDGVASASRPLFVGTGISYVPTPMLCHADSTTSTGTRCGGGTLDPGEQCDDGNGDDGDGCSSSCQTEAGAPVAEHLKCYGVKDLRNPAFAPTTVDLADELVVNDGTFEAKKPFLFCTPVSVDGSPIVNSAAYVTCYKAKGPKLSSAMRPSIEIGDALGTLQLEVAKPRFVCLRSTKTPLP